MNFEVQPGEIIGSMGPSGAGKSATFNLIAGEYRPDAGSIQYDGSDITGLPPHRIVELVIGRGLMSNPRLMLLDEMTLGMGPVVVNTLYKTLNEIREEDIPILYVEQNVRRSLAEADRAYIMEAGWVVRSGEAGDLREE